MMRHLAPQSLHEGPLGAAAIDALDCLLIGVIFVDRRSGVMAMNRVADEIVAEADGLVVVRDILGAASAPQTSALRTLIGEAARPGSGNGRVAGGAMALTRPSMKRPLSVLVAPLPTNGFDLGVAPPATVFVSDPERRLQPAADVVSGLYGLTGAEARLAVGVASGLSLREVAAESEVSINTARSTLKAIFKKTETNRQGELVKLLLTGPAVMSRSDGDQP
ncbi:MAG: helix-turn-helix transcriptional regulator [Alphaproteobacteria bacterium]|nr:helix-turn-helix transcriptional regulator [Alphaproteobacteria bacterium]